MNISAAALQREVHVHGMLVPSNAVPSWNVYSLFNCAI